ncbi:MAG: serine/threonine-protein kinase [Planctomycetota bacterium]|nr:serine/threonine-protein kinase [Planctomycetota bacterium]
MSKPDDNDDHPLETVLFNPNATLNLTGGVKPPIVNSLLQRYDQLVQHPRMSWTVHQGLTKRLGQGGQGVVYLSERRGADGFTLPLAIKVFSPERYESPQAYEHSMLRVARVAARVAQIQQDNLLDVHDFVDRHRIRLMVMEWIDGYDLSYLFSNDLLLAIEAKVSRRRWENLNSVVVTSGPVHPRLKPGIAVAILRDCLAALAALHREGIVHGDIKPSNVMLKRTGAAKIIDIGSAFEIQQPPNVRSCTPRYAAPEVLEGGLSTPRSDLASLGYMLIEMLSGRPAFMPHLTFQELMEAKLQIGNRLQHLLPNEVSCNELLMNFCRRLVTADPMRRFPDAEAADLVQDGAAAFHRQLAKSDLASEYDNEIRLWLDELSEVTGDHN